MLGGDGDHALLLGHGDDLHQARGVGHPLHTPLLRHHHPLGPHGRPAAGRDAGARLALLGDVHQLRGARPGLDEDAGPHGRPLGRARLHRGVEGGGDVLAGIPGAPAVGRLLRQRHAPALQRLLLPLGDELLGAGGVHGDVDGHVAPRGVVHGGGVDAGQGVAEGHHVLLAHGAAGGQQVHVHTGTLQAAQGVLLPRHRPCRLLQPRLRVQLVGAHRLVLVVDGVMAPLRQCPQRILGRRRRQDPLHRGTEVADGVVRLRERERGVSTGLGTMACAKHPSLPSHRGRPGGRDQHIPGRQRCRSR